MPADPCRQCPQARNALNGTYCQQLNRYVQHADKAPCRPPQTTSNMDNQQVAIIKPENMQAIVQAAPQSYADNRASHDRCLAAGQAILAAIQAQGMDDGLDHEAAAFLDKARRTVKAMNERRSAVTKLFDEVRSAFTSLENDIDPAKPGTVPHQLQQLRNQHAARKHAEAEARRREAEARRLAEEDLRKFRQDVEDDFKQQHQELVNAAINALTEKDNAVTLENYDSTLAELKNFGRELPENWASGLKSRVRIPVGVATNEVKAVEQEVRERLSGQLREQYAFEVGSTLDYILDHLPSKKANFERIAQANAEEAARIKAEMEARQQAEAARMEQERREREAAEKQKAETERQAAEMASLFDAQAAASTSSKARVTKRINLLNPEGIMPVISLWWSKEGRNLSVDELAKMFKKQIAFCEKLANKEGLLIESENVEYVDEVKAK